MCEEFEFDEDNSVDDAIKEYLFDVRMKPIIDKRLKDGLKPIPVNLEDLL